MAISLLTQVLNVNNTLAQALQEVLNLVENKDEDSFIKSRTQATKEYYSITDTDDAISLMLNTLTLFAAKKCRAEYKAETCEDFLLKYETTFDQCNCNFSKSMLLPCRHIFFKRRITAGMNELCALVLILYNKRFL